MPDITSRQHPMVQAFKRAARREGPEVLLDGWHLLHEAAAATLELSVVAVTGTPPTPGDAQLLAELGTRCNLLTVGPTVMDALSPVRAPSGVVALATPRVSSLQHLLQPPPALIVMAMGVQDPGNVGAIVRSAEAGGATGVIFGGGSADPWGWKALRAAMGSTFRLPCLRDDGSVVRSLKSYGIPLVAAIPSGGTPLERIDLRGDTALVVGGEGAGLDGDVLDTADAQVSIPMRPPVESLNVAVAAALLVYEARRQRAS